jgi:multiple sugar transport system substrate-binding protein
MAALEAFSSRSINAIGGKDTFLPSLWDSSLVFGQPQIWAIPWLADTRILFFRRDLLQQADIDEDAAFNSPDALENTLLELQKSGIYMPWVIPTGQTRMTIHHIASWIWGAGGNFLSEDGNKALLNEREALDGLTKYFRLARFLATEAQHKDDVESDRLYWSGKAAITMSGTWLLTEKDTPESVRVNTGFISPPGVPFIGGSHLVIWRHSKEKQEASLLIRYLEESDVQMAYSKSLGLLPANLDLISSPTFNDDPQYKRMIERLKVGRSFRSVPLWGMVENRISATLSGLWAAILNNQNADVGEIVKQHITPLNRKINLILQED